MTRPTKDRRRARRATVATFCIVVTLLAAVYVFVGDDTLWGEWLTVAPPMLWAIALIPTVVRLRSWLASAFVLGFVAVTSELPRLGAEARASEEALRLVSWNIGAGNTSWSNAVAELDPDIVLVQESMKPTSVWDGFSWAGTPDPAALSRFPIEALPTGKVGPWTEPQLLLAHIRDRKVLIANVRLMLPSPVIQLVAPFEESPRENYEARIGQYQKLATLARTTAERIEADAVIVAGDFNVPARMRSLAPLESFLQDAWLEAGHGWGATVPELFPFTRIDHVWTSDEIEVLSVRVHFLDGSDHRAVVMDFEL